MGSDPGGLYPSDYISQVRRVLIDHGMNESQIDEEIKQIKESKNSLGEYIRKLDPEMAENSIYRYLYIKVMGDKLGKEVNS